VTSQQPPRTSPRVEPRFSSTQSNGKHASSNGNKLGESEFLSRESEQSKQAATVAIKQAAKDLGHAVDPRAWTAQHPWIALATAAVGGFVAATQVVPSKDEQLLKQLEKIREAVMPEITRKTTTEREREVAAEQLDGDGKPKKKDSRGFLSVIGTELIKYMGPALSSALSAAIAGQSVANSAERADDARQREGTQDPAASI
jgi:hypothetical protein